LDDNTAPQIVPEAPIAPEPTLLELAAQQSKPTKRAEKTPAREPADDNNEEDAEELAAGSEDTDETGDDDGEGNPDADQADDEDDDGEEVEWEGNQYRLPKGIKDALLRQADYTRKTQEVAETRREAEAAKVAVYQQAQLFQSAGPLLVQQQDAMAKLEELDRTLDFRKLEATDPVAAQSWWRYREQLKEYVGKVGAHIEQTQQQLHFVQQQETARRVENMNRVLTKKIKGWSPELNAKISEHAIRKLGYAPDEVAAISDPRVAETVYKAYKYDELVAKNKTRPKSATTTKEPVQPTGKISKGGPGASARKPIDRMSAGEYIEYMSRKERTDKQRDRDGRFGR
jgi:hypothetical protein